MWYLVVGVFLYVGVNGDVSSNIFCASLNPQPHVIIDQIMGMWFGVEIVYHQEDLLHQRKELSCPIIHISEDRERTSTYNPLYGGIDYRTGFGQNGYAPDFYGPNREGYGVSRKVQTTVPMTKTVQQDIRRRLYEQAEYDRRTTYGNYPSVRKQYLYDTSRQLLEMKYLRLIWDENGESTEFHMRYNVSKAGFWISSGPENGGSSLDPQFGHFAGTIQVLKAVGNHMVLTFCHQLPERKLYTIILSRELKLDHIEVHGVHNMLHRKNLQTKYIKKVCNNAGHNLKINFVSYSFVLLFVYLVGRIMSFNSC